MACILGIMAVLWIVLATLLHSGNGHRLQLENGLGRTPPMGWNSWNHFGCHINESIVKETAQALVSTGLAALGYTYVNIDDCWSEMQRDKEGKLVANSATFPSGIKALADFVHEQNLKLGIYSDAGFLTCERRPGSLGHEYIDAKTFGSWDVDYLKYDNCYNDLTKPELRYPVMRDALNSTGRQIFFSMCEWGVDNPAEWASNVGNSWRTTGDIKDSWFSMTRIADFNDHWASFAGPGGWNDPDMLEVGNGGMNHEEYRAHFSIWALMKAPLILGCDIRNLKNETIEIITNKEVIAVNQDSLGVQGRRVSSKGFLGFHQIWTGPLSAGRTVVVIWNRGFAGAKIKLHWEELSIPTSAVVSIRDLWKNQDLGDFSGSLELNVASHGVRMLIVSPALKSSF